MYSTCIAIPPEEEAVPDCGDEPQKHVGQQYPDCVLHAFDAAVALGVFWDVHLAENAKSDKVADEDEQVDEEEKEGLDER